MSRLWLALVPSLQDQNVVKYPAPNGPTREMAQMNALTTEYVAELTSTFKDCGIVWKVIGGTPYSQVSDYTKALYPQEYAARDWLNKSPAGVPALSLNIHSDAGASTSWVAYCYDSRGTHSREIGKAICQKLQPIFAENAGTTAIRSVDYTTYVMAKVMANTSNVALLIEHGNHQNAADNLTLATKGRRIARASIAAILDHYGIPYTLPAPPTEEEDVFTPTEISQVPPEIVAYASAKALGSIRLGKGLTYQDGAQDWIAKTTKGAVILQRHYDPPGDLTVQIEHVDWQPNPPPTVVEKIVEVPVYPSGDALRASAARLRTEASTLDALAEGK